MATPFSMEWMIITNGQEKRVNSEDNLFEIKVDGYKIFPMNEPLEIKRQVDAEQIGTAVVEEIVLKGNVTLCKYRLISLYSVN